MFFKIVFNYLYGFVNITMEGFYIERLMNYCIQQKIFLWGMKRKNSSLLTANVNIKDFKKICRIARKTKCKISINSKKGLPILLHRYRKRRLLAILVLPIAFIIFISSRFIWNIEIIGTENISQETILEVLKEEGVSIGAAKDKIDTLKVVRQIRLKRDDIAWMSIDMKGTNILVTIVEAEKKPAMIDQDEYCNIVAAQDGMIMKITADTGTLQVQTGDIVKKGDVLIGGYMEGKYVDKREVHAKGQVLAKVWYTKKIQSGLTREISEETGNQKNIYEIHLHNFKINLYKTLPNFQNYDTIKGAKRIQLWEHFYLPIEIQKTTYIEKKTVSVTYGKEELRTLLMQELEKQFQEEGIDQLNIINKVVNFYEKENEQTEIEMTYEVLEDIGIEEKVGK